LEEEVEAIGQAATAIGARMVWTIPVAENDSRTLVATLEFAEFLALIPHARPRVVYLWKRGFEAHAMALHSLIDNDDDTGEEVDEEVGNEIANDARFASIVKRWCSRDGEIGSFVASFILDGILHTAVESEAWLDEFNDDVSELAESLGEDTEGEEARIAAAELAEIRDKAKQLAADPLFNGPKVSRAKREYLARHLFADMEERTISFIVEEAENMQWLETGHRKQS
jgi:hypothetical protein